MRRTLLVPGARRTAGLLVALLLALGVLLAVQVAHPPAAQARYPYATMRDVSVTKAADEVLTVDVLGVDDPAAGATWVRSSACLWDGVCVRRLVRDGVTFVANDDGTLTLSRDTREGGKSWVDFSFADTQDGQYAARLFVTDQPAAAPRAGDPDPAVRARLRVTAQKRTTYVDHAGQAVNFVSTVANTGNVALEGLALSNASSRFPAPTCSPVPVGGTLPAGASTTCSATLTVTQDMIDLTLVRTNVLTATGRAVRDGITYRARGSAIATASPIQLPHLSMTGSVQPASVSSPDQPVAYAFVVRNDGKVTVRNLLVRAPFPGLGGLVCAPVPLGGTLAPAQTTTCRASRTVPADLLGRTALTDTARASAQTYWRTVNATSQVSVALSTQAATPQDPVTAPDPVARPDTVSTTVGHPVVVAVLGNDSPGSATVPLVGPSLRLRLTPDLYPTPQLYGDAKTLIVPALFDRPADPYAGGVAFLVSGKGEIVVVPLTSKPREPVTIGYQVTDANGRSARSTLTVTTTG